MAELTHDTFFDGKIKISQSRDGYRFSVDAPLLAAVVTPKAGERLIDLGTGCGVIPLLLAYRFPEVKITAVELQNELAELALSNVASNRMDQAISVVCGDIRQLSVNAVQGPFDWVVSNPPFHVSGSGRINPNHQRALARHEIMLDLTQLMQCARKMLKTGGYFATVYTADRAVELLLHMRQTGIEPKWIRWVHSRDDEDAKLLLVKGVKAGRPGVNIAPPLVVYRKDGSYTDSAQCMLRP